jgi:hypothetical protein
MDLGTLNHPNKKNAKILISFLVPNKHCARFRIILGMIFKKSFERALYQI